MNALLKGKNIALIFIIALCCYAIVITFNMGRANLKFYSVHQTLAYWQKNNKVTDQEEFEHTVKLINQATNLHPDNPKYLITQGLVYEWGGIDADSIGLASSVQYFKSAEQSYLKAIELRPTWPGTWATLAILKWRLNEIDQQLIDYLLLADKFGEHNEQVQDAWLEVGFYLYKSKSRYTAKIIKGLRKHLRSMIEDTRSDRNYTAKQIIERHKVESLACNWITSFNLESRQKVSQVCPE